MVEKQTLCHVINGKKILLKKAVRGVSKGKWNAPGGNIENGETDEQCATREVLEETGLKVDKLFKHGVLNFHLDGKEELSVSVTLFSTKSFDGTVKSTEEGEVKWFDIDNLPVNQMWDDDRYWLHLMLEQKKFGADFYISKSGMVTKHSISMVN